MQNFYLLFYRNIYVLDVNQALLKKWQMIPGIVYKPMNKSNILL